MTIDWTVDSVQRQMDKLEAHSELIKTANPTRLVMTSIMPWYRCALTNVMLLFS